MSADHNSSHGHGSGPEKAELTHPVLWTVGLLFIITLLVWWFASWMTAGKVEARKHAPIPLPNAAAGGGEPDHLALIAKKDQAVLDEGATLFGKNCASCHGPNGDTNPTNLSPAPRNLRTDAMKNAKGAGPYGLYTVLTSGYGGAMPGFPALSAEQRYAIVHHMRETIITPANKERYVDDSEAVKKSIPAAGGGEAAPVVLGEAPERFPERVESKAPVLPLMAGTAAQADALQTELVAWAARAKASAPAELASATADFAVLVERRPGVGQALRTAVQANDRAAFTRLLAHEDGTGAIAPSFVLLGSRLDALFTHLRSQQEAK